MSIAPPQPSDSVFADVLPREHPMIHALDDAYRELEVAMRPHGCTRCHAPDLVLGNRRTRIRHAMQVLDLRRSIEAMVEANLMPPPTAGHPAGIADDAARARLLRRATAFRTLGDVALASW
ncbi:MAG: hypothetical protein H0V17_02165 [Deltaproteobacteria bacterium]|nr:hypothetical protein [Deltaproteobacteria bacterium]